MAFVDMAWPEDAAKRWESVLLSLGTEATRIPSQQDTYSVMTMYKFGRLVDINSDPSLEEPSLVRVMLSLESCK